MSGDFRFWPTLIGNAQALACISTEDDPTGEADSSSVSSSSPFDSPIKSLDEMFCDFKMTARGNSQEPVTLEDSFRTFVALKAAGA